MCGVGLYIFFPNIEVPETKEVKICERFELILLINIQFSKHLFPLITKLPSPIPPWPSRHVGGDALKLDLCT